ncbi:MAG: TetR/AcrR family transcriptional regulator [Actinobacteria bacterium]|nr:TetR/AcrR family transcriptional regulator [Actinomycetota bacterium]
MSTSTDRPLRADARRNREKVLAAATAAFAETGFDAQVEDIARRAGVGVGTVYRHFPTKDALVDALAETHFGHLADLLEAALQREGDPWEIFVDTIWKAAAPAVADIGSCEIIAGHPRASDAAPLSRERLNAASDKLIARAQASGSMRADATTDDIATIMCGFGHIAAARRAGSPLSWERYLTIALDGLRAR